MEMHRKIILTVNSMIFGFGILVSDGSRDRTSQQRRYFVRLYALLFFFSSGCNTPSVENQTSSESAVSAPLKSLKMFVNVTEEVGLNFVHDDGPTECYEIPRAIGSGCGWIDANGDKLLDILVVDGGREVDPNNNGMLAALYLQSEGGRFQDFSEEAGFKGTGYGMGVAVGDIDNDGDQDVYLTKYGADQLFLNDGTGRFADVTLQTGIENVYWSTAVAMTDLNSDGWLDIVVGNYVDYFPGTFCGDASGRQEFGGPRDFPGTPNRVFINLGRGSDGAIHFTDHSAKSGVAAVASKTLGLVCRDFNSDGLIDIFVANDAEANQLWIQNSDAFTDEAYLRGVAVNRFGEPEGNMGTVIGDFTGDQEQDLIVTHLSGEMNTLWQGDSNGYFTDQTSRFRFGPAGLAQTGFGIVATDLDFNGSLDFLVANGRVNRDPHRVATGKGFWEEYSERNQIFVADSGNFLEVDDEVFTKSSEVWRALATGDYDRDGDLDLLATSIGRPLRLFKNEVKRVGHWLCVSPYDPVRKRIADGAVVTISTDNRRWTIDILSHTSFLSSHQPLASFGLGAETEIKSIEIIWPDDPMNVEVFPGSTADQYVELSKGSGVRRYSLKKEEGQ